MILEALHYAASWPLTGKNHRRYIGASVSLWARARRCRNAWQAHEEQSKAAILERAAQCRQRRTAVVLGSGLLRDVPIKELSRMFDTVVLVDLVHLFAVRAKITLKGGKNIRLIERDLSGLDALILGETPDPLGFLRQVPYLDFVVSANLLSQIGIGARRRMAGQIAEDQLEGWIDQMICAHIHGLSTIAATALLVTDISFTLRDHTGAIREDVEMIEARALPDSHAMWVWTVAPHGEEAGGHERVHRVGTYCF